LVFELDLVRVCWKSIMGNGRNRANLSS